MSICIAFLNVYFVPLVVQNVSRFFLLCSYRWVDGLVKVVWLALVGADLALTGGVPAFNRVLDFLSS